MSAVSNVYYYFESILRGLGHSALFFKSAIKWWFRKPFRLKETIVQIEFIGYRSVHIIALTGMFTGLVLAFQTYTGFNIVNMNNLVGPTVALGIARELGPVLTGLIVAARAGGAMAAQIGTMRVTEQIDALEVMGVNPLNYLVGPRIIAAVISLPILCALFDFVAMVGAYFLSTTVLGLDGAIFIDKVYFFLDPQDINQGLIKSAFFGLLFSTICTFRGFYTTGGARGVGNATNEGVVLSMVLIIVTDYFLTNIIVFLMKWTS